MALLVADDTGLLKQIRIDDQRVLHTFGEQKFERSIQHMVLDGNNVYNILKSGHMETCDLLSGSITNSVQVTTRDCVGFDILRTNQTRRYLTCTKQGRVDIRSFADPTPNDSPYKVGTSNVFRMRLEQKEQTSFATGGRSEQNFLKVWNVETGQQTFRCRNLPHDMLNLAHPFWINDLQFSPQVSLSPSPTHYCYTVYSFHL